MSRPSSGWASWSRSGRPTGSSRAPGRSSPRTMSPAASGSVPTMSQDTRHFGEEIEELKQRLLMMGGLAEDRLSFAVQALVERDRHLIATVVRGDEAINTLQLEIDDRCFKLLALHQPMAIDL